MFAGHNRPIKADGKVRLFLPYFKLNYQLIFNGAYFSLKAIFQNWSLIHKIICTGRNT